MANKKINQLVLKTTIQSTDLFPLGDATTGQLYKKTIAELQAAIGGAVISVNGLVGTVVLDTDDIQELASPTNKYFTDARARSAISLTTSGSSGASTYSSSTGVLNVPTYTLAGLGGITAGFLSGGTGITYNSSTGVISYSGTVFTDASIRALVSAGTGLSYNSTTGVFSYSGTVYTDSSIRALISLTTTGSSGASTYNNTTGVLNIPNYTLSGLGGISLTSLSGSAPITYNSSTGAIGITQATTSTNGYLSSTDWNTFNGKQSALTLGNFTEATSSVLTITGGTGAIIGSGLTVQVKLASGSQSGYLSSTDWTTFNSKQNALTNPVTGTGTASYHARWTSSSAIGVSNIFEDSNGTLVISGTSTTGAAGSGSSRGNLLLAGTTSNKITFNNNSTTVNGYLYSDSSELQIDSGAGYMNFRVNGSERMRITSAGNVGIGTTSPGELLHLSKATYPYIKLTETTANTSGQFGYDSPTAEWRLRTLTSTPLTFGTNDTERMRITSDGLVRIGSSTDTRSFQITRNRTAFINAEGVSVAIGSSNAPLEFYSNNVNAINVTTGGNVLINTTTDNGEKLYVSGSIRATGSITANSDARLKKNIERIENALQKVSEISGYTYNSIYDEDRHAGVIAQEIDKVLPEIVNKGNDGLMGVEYGNISALLIEAIKDLKVQNDSLQARLSALEK